jgi:4'-phosphopantetheinyl transferase
MDDSRDPAAIVDVVWGDPRELPSLEALLDDNERARLCQLRQPADRERFVAAHGLLRLLIAEWTGCEPADVELTAMCRRCGGRHGKPRLLAAPGAPQLHLSLAHAGDRVVVAVTRAGPVGVDVEAHAKTGFEGFDEIALSPSERVSVDELGESQRLCARTMMWVRKEAALKATGDGLMVSPRDLVVSSPDESARLLGWYGEAAPTAIQLRDLDIGADHEACIAVIAETPPIVRLRSWRALTSAHLAGRGLDQSV